MGEINHQLDESNDNWPFLYALGRLLLTSVLVVKSATGLNFTPLCSPNL